MMKRYRPTLTLPAMPERARAIIEDVASRHRLRPTDLVGPSRSHKLVAARYEAMARIRALDPAVYSIVRIGRMFNRDHSTVFHGLQTHNRLDSPARYHAKAPRADGPTVDTPRASFRSSAASDDRSSEYDDG